ncbi:MAG: TlpA family protein disulfide reductase [Chloroflexi bacterium]|nr:TlpA family protein disulfide reductase [Chloroflexota bacterium]
MTKAKLLIMLLLAILLISACKSVAPASEQSPPPPAVSQLEPSSIPSSPPAIAPAEPAPTPTPPFPEPTPPPVTAPAPTPVIKEGFNVGNRAIDFELQTLTGDNVSLSGLRGKPVLLNFWATWCVPCKLEMPFLQQVQDKYKDSGLVVLAVDLIGTRTPTVTENPETVRKFMSELNLSLIVPLDEGLKLTKANAITGIPTTFFIDKDGIIRFKMIGAFPNVQTIERELTKIMPVQP